MAEPVWTSAPPSRPGWYWMRSQGTLGRPREVEVAPTGVLCVVTDFGYAAVKDCTDSKWAGPIPEPREATDGP